MKTLFFKNIPISYSDEGKGETIVFLHGFLENKKMWRKLSDSLIKNYRIICIDLLGHGQTPSFSYIHTMELQAEMVLFVVNQLKINTFSVIGHSMGGYVSLALLENNLEKINKLILLNSTAIEDSLERKINRDRAIKVVKKDYSVFVSMSIANLFSEKNREKLKIEIENTKNEALLTPLQGIIAALEGMKIRKDRQFLLKKNQEKILLILGSEDPVLNFLEHKNQIKNTTILLETLKGGHMSHLENYEDLARILKSFL